MEKTTAEAMIRDKEDKRRLWHYPDNFDEFYDRHYKYNFDIIYRVVGVEIH